MPDSTVRDRKTSRLVSAIVAVAIFAADQITKSMVARSIPEHAIIPIIPHFFNLTDVKNSGAAFGMFSDQPAPWKTVVLILISGALLVSVLVFAWRSHRLHWQATAGLALILGGALSNLVDRIRLGRVLDFLDFYYGSYHWYTFNLADSAIVVGAGLLILQVVFGG